MIGKTNATLEITSEMVNLTLQTNQNDHDDLLGTEIIVTYADVVNTYIWEGRELLIKIPKYAKKRRHLSLLFYIKNYTGKLFSVLITAYAAMGSATRINTELSLFIVVYSIFS